MDSSEKGKKSNTVDHKHVKLKKLGINLKRIEVDASNSGELYPQY